MRGGLFCRLYFDHFYYIRLKPTCKAKRVATKIEPLLACPQPAVALFNQLLPGVKVIARNCRGYRAETLESESHWSAKDYLDKIIQQRVGACRHRVIAFAQLMKQRFPNVSVQMITSGDLENNEIHIYAEVYHKGIWVPCDLGGYPANVKVNKNILTEQADDDHRALDLEAPENIYTLTLSSQGKVLPPDYLKKAENLVTLTLRDMTDFAMGRQCLLGDQ